VNEKYQIWYADASKKVTLNYHKTWNKIIALPTVLRPVYLCRIAYYCPETAIASGKEWRDGVPCPPIQWYTAYEIYTSPFLFHFGEIPC